MLTRRGLFKLVGAALAAPYLPRPNLTTWTNRLWTVEAMEDLHGLPAADWTNDGTYNACYHAVRRDLIDAIAAREEAAIYGTSRND